MTPYSIAIIDNKGFADTPGRYTESVATRTPRFCRVYVLRASPTSATANYLKYASMKMRQNREDFRMLASSISRAESIRVNNTNNEVKYTAAVMKSDQGLDAKRFARISTTRAKAVAEGTAMLIKAALASTAFSTRSLSAIQSARSNAILVPLGGMLVPDVYVARLSGSTTRENIAFSKMFSEVLG